MAARAQDIEQRENDEQHGAKVIPIKKEKQSVKLSTLHNKVKGYRQGFVKVYEQYKGATVLNEDGTEMSNGRGVQRITAAYFARAMGIPVSTFKLWLSGQVQDAPSPKVTKKRPYAKFVKGLAEQLSNAEVRYGKTPEELLQAIAKKMGITVEFTTDGAE